MPADPLLAALDDALECSAAQQLPRADRLVITLWWLIESVAVDFEMPAARAAEEVAILCELVTEMIAEARRLH